MTKLLLILIVAIAVLWTVEAESFECRKKRQKAFQSPIENYLDYQLEQISRKNGIEVEKEPSDEECDKERELDRQNKKRYRGSNKRRSISEQLYLALGSVIGVVIVFVLIIIPLVLLVVYVDNKYDIIPPRPKPQPNQNAGWTQEGYFRCQQCWIETENIRIRMLNQNANSDEMWKRVKMMGPR